VYSILHTWRECEKGELVVSSRIRRSTSRHYGLGTEVWIDVGCRRRRPGTESRTMLHWCERESHIPTHLGTAGSTPWFTVEAAGSVLAAPDISQRVTLGLSMIDSRQALQAGHGRSETRNSPRRGEAVPMKNQLPPDSGGSSNMPRQLLRYF
jgi:hypothetical protein